jgi:anti-sigma factor RsiW
MKAMNCEQVAAAAPELALGILPGDERAAALAHLDDCPSCQQEVGSMVGLTDTLLLLTPTAQPPAGFEQRVLETLTEAHTVSQPARARRWRSRVTVAALAVAACVVLALAVAVGLSGRGTPALAAEEMRTGTGTVVGEVFVHREEPAVLFMSLPGWSAQIASYGEPSKSYTLHIERRDAPPRVLPVSLTSDATWATTLDFDPATITNVAMIDSNGQVWCHADFQ